MTLALINLLSSYSALTFFIIFIISFLFNPRKKETLIYACFYLFVSCFVFCEYVLTVYKMPVDLILLWGKQQHVYALFSLSLLPFICRKLSGNSIKKNYYLSIITLSALFIIILIPTDLILKQGTTKIASAVRLYNRIGPLYFPMSLFIIWLLVSEFYLMIKKHLLDNKKNKALFLLILGFGITFLTVFYDLFNMFFRYREKLGLPAMIPFGIFILIISTGLAFIIKYFETLNDLKESQKKIKLLFDKSKRKTFELIELIASILDAKDKYTAGHSERITDYATQIAKALHLPKKEIIILKTACLLHDIGKIGISEYILNKPDQLTKKEFAEIKKHPVIGVQILSHYHPFVHVLPYIYHHHERIDGMGYPKGLKGKQIPFLCRIIAVADTFDAITSDRPYRKAMDLKKAIKILNLAKGTQLDTEIVDCFTEILEKKKK